MISYGLADMIRSLAMGRIHDTMSTTEEDRMSALDLFQQGKPQALPFNFLLVVWFQ